MPSKSLLQRGFTVEAERLAESYRIQLSISKFDPLNAFALAQHLKISISSVKEIFLGNHDNVNYSILSDTSKFNAMWMPDEEGNKIIIHNDNHSPFRQQSNIMHELSHIIRKHEIPLEKAQLCHQFNLHYYNLLHEQEAKYLGGCLQITRAGLLWAFKRNLTKEQISDYYSASIEMVNYRVNTSGVGRQLHYKKI